MNKKLGVLILGILLLTSCSPKYIEVPVETVKTEYVDKVKYDSIYIHDSIETLIKGDTVYKTKVLYRYKYKELKDTLIRVDTIPKVIIQEVVREKEVNKLKWYQTVLIYLGLGSLLFLGGKVLLNKIKSWV